VRIWFPNRVAKIKPILELIDFGYPSSISTRRALSSAMVGFSCSLRRLVERLMTKCKPSPEKEQEFRALWEKRKQLSASA
jgi:hypothetical protein